MVKILNKENTILNKFLAQMRDKSVQGDSMRFRRNMERVAEIMAYEIFREICVRQIHRTWFFAFFARFA